MNQMPGYIDKIQPTDAPEVVNRKIESLVARNATVRVMDISDQSTEELRDALAFARHIDILTNASAGDLIESFGVIRQAFGNATGDSDKPLWALTNEKSAVRGIRTEVFYASPTIYNRYATLGQLRAFTKPITEEIKSKLH